MGGSVLAAGIALPGIAAPAPEVLQVVGPWEIGGLAPAASGYIFTRMQVCETLMGASDDGLPEAGLARAWRVSADGMEWRLDLRPQARFHDQTPVTAAAVVRCLQGARTAPAVLSAAPIRSIEADGAAVVVIRLTSRFGLLPALLAHSSTLILAPGSYAADGSVRAIIGSGPYRITSLTPPQQLEAAAWEQFDGPQPLIKRVRYLSAGRAETRALMAQSGQADLAYALDPASIERLRGRPAVRIESVSLPRTMILKLNAGKPELADPRVRRALSLAIDRRGLAQAVLRDPGMAATQLFPHGLRGWHDEALAPLAHDPAQAATLLEQAGWRRSGQGLVDARGNPFTLQLRTFPDRPELPVVAAALQEQWRQAGIAVRVSIGNSGDIPLGHRDGSLQLGLAARNYANVPDPTGTLLQDFGPQGGDWGAMGWHSQALSDALAALAHGGLAASRIASLRRQVSAIVQSELPVIPLAWYRQHVAVDARLAGVRLDPLERSYRLTEMAWKM